MPPLLPFAVMPPARVKLLWESRAKGRELLLLMPWRTTPGAMFRLVKLKTAMELRPLPEKTPVWRTVLPVLSVIVGAALSAVVLMR